MRRGAWCVWREGCAGVFHAPRTTHHATSTLDRSVKPELLDTLPPSDPRAVRSRRDLLRVNAWMGNAAIMTGALRSACPGISDRRLVDLGAGDGRFLGRVAQHLAPGWQGTSALLLDRWTAVSPETLRALAALGWHATTVQADGLAWLRQTATPSCDVMLANLFLHHFAEAQLAALVRAAAGLTRTFIAVEPRRSVLGLFFSRLLRLIGCSSVTRHDAQVSVRGGFTGRELSRLWPDGNGWSLAERPAGWFSHLFIAQRKE